MAVYNRSYSQRKEINECYIIENKANCVHLLSLDLTHVSFFRGASTKAIHVAVLVPTLHCLWYQISGISHITFKLSLMDEMS